MTAHHNPFSRSWKIPALAMMMFLGAISLTSARCQEAGKPHLDAQGAGPADRTKPSSDKAKPPPAETDWDAQAEAKLQVRIPKMAFEDTEFENVITFLRDVTGLNIDVEWGALSSVSVDKTAKVTVHLNNVTVEKALRVITANLSYTTPVDFVIDEGRVVIATRDVLAKRTTVKAYDVRDLLCGDSLATDDAWPPEAAEQLVATITRIVEPVPYDAKGQLLTVTQRGHLLISRSWAGHREIAHLLDQLRASVPKWQRDIRHKLQVVIPKLEFSNFEFDRVLSFLRDVSGTNIVLDPAADSLAQSTITMKANNLTAAQALSLVARMKGLHCRLVDGVVYVTPKAPPRPRARATSRPATAPAPAAN